MTANTSSLGPNDALIVTAVVTDPDGSADLIGGELRSATGSSYGAFQGEEGGVYSITVPWELLHEVEAIDGFAQQDRALVAHFFDMAAHETTKTLMVALECANTYEFCDARCVNLAADSNHCGECRRGLGNGAQCSNGGPVCGNAELLLCGDACVASNTQNCGACGNDCSVTGMSAGMDQAFCDINDDSCVFRVTLNERGTCAMACGALSCVSGTGRYQDEFGVQYQALFECTDMLPAFITVEGDASLLIPADYVEHTCQCGD